MKRLTLIAIALSLSATVQIANAKPPKGYPNCPFDNATDCALDASVDKFANNYRAGKYTRPDGTMDFDLMAKDSKADHADEKANAVMERKQHQEYLAEHAAELARVQAAREELRDSVKGAQHYLDHYEPVTECQPSQIMSRQDMQNQWAGISSGPQGMDCQTTYVPVYR